MPVARSLSLFFRNVLLLKPWQLPHNLIFCLIIARVTAEHWFGRLWGCICNKSKHGRGNGWERWSGEGSWVRHKWNWKWEQRERQHLGTATYLNSLMALKWHLFICVHLVILLNLTDYSATWTLLLCLFCLVTSIFTCCITRRTYSSLCSSAFKGSVQPNSLLYKRHRKYLFSGFCITF